MTNGFKITRRSLPALALAGLAGVENAQAGASGPDSVAFQVWRNGKRIGAHAVNIAGSQGRWTARIEAEMVVRIAGVPLFRYRHDATETWDVGRFLSLASRSVTNGKVEIVSAERRGEGVHIVRSKGAALAAPAASSPLTHWNHEALSQPLFNPQTGALIRASVTRRGQEAVRYADGRTVQAAAFVLSGDASIVDWYDAAGTWTALRGKGPDGSTIEYRRV